DPDKLIRPRPADSIKACGHCAAPTGRTHDRKRLLLLLTPKILADRGPSTHETLPELHTLSIEVAGDDVAPGRVIASKGGGQSALYASVSVVALWSVAAPSRSEHVLREFGRGVAGAARLRTAPVPLLEPMTA